MKAWPNILNLILIIILVLLFTGVIDTHQPVKVSDQILGFMKQTNSKGAIAIGQDGSISVVDADGKPMPKCGIVPNDKNPHCKGLGGNNEIVQSSKMFNILHVKGSTCILVIGTDNKAYQLCY